jgi:general secretion pathway protein E
VSAVEVLASFAFESPKGVVVDQDLLTRLVAADVGLVYEKPDPLKLDAELITSVMNRPYAQRHSCVPLRRANGRTVIALADPFDIRLKEELTLLCDGNVTFQLSSKRDIQNIIATIYGFQNSVSAAAEQHGITVDVGNLEQLVKMKNVDQLEADASPVVAAVEYLLHYAFNQRASDIHIEPKRDRSHVRLRIDGVLHEVYTLPRAVHPPLTSRLKMMARMDISEKRRPQDGRIKMSRRGAEIELRVSSLPVAFGEKIVIRIFDPHTLIQDLGDIGFNEEELQTWQRFIARPNGLVLVTGPTGSGKTTTLYSSLMAVAGPEVNVTTVEDPIEMVNEAFNQVLVQKKVGVTFAVALRTILRQDPDVVMVGEIRDEETARMATTAAQTGHLVFSTLHTNDAASTITRMLDMGIEPFLLSSNIVGVMAQRLVRTICTGCKTDTFLAPEQVELLPIPHDVRSQQKFPVAYGAGCDRCRGTGYYGRTAIFELLPISDTIRKLINANASAPEIRRAARADDVRSLTDSALRKLAQKVTTFEEVMAVMHD